MTSTGLPFEGSEPLRANPAVPAAGETREWSVFVSGITGVQHLEVTDPKAFEGYSGEVLMALMEVIDASPVSEDAKRVISPIMLAAWLTHHKDRASNTNTELTEAREDYVEAMTRRLGFRHRKERKQRRQETEERYTDAVLQKIGSVVSGQALDVFEVGQLPAIIEGVSFSEGTHQHPEELAKYHLHVLSDTLLAETERRHKGMSEITHTRFDRLMRMMRGSGYVRGFIFGGIVAATLLPDTHIVPENQESYIHTAEHVVEGVAALIFTYDIQNSIYRGISNYTNSRRQRRERVKITEDPQLRKLAEQIAYGGVNYDRFISTISSTTEREAPADETSGKLAGKTRKEERRQAEQFAREIGRNYKVVEGQPGGYIYSGKSALTMSARLLIEHADDVQSITTSESPDENYMDLARDLLREDLQVFRHEVSGNTLRRFALRAVSLALSVFMHRPMAHLNEARSLGTESAKHLKGEHSK